MLNFGLAGKKDITFWKDHLNVNDGTDVLLTVKNYFIDGGLPTEIHQTTDETYEIQGPLGMGLDI